MSDHVMRYRIDSLSSNGQWYTEVFVRGGMADGVREFSSCVRTPNGASRFRLIDRKSGEILQEREARNGL